MSQTPEIESLEFCKDLVIDYLKAMEKRELDVAQSMIAASFVMEFPGSGAMHSFQELIDWAKLRYQFVTKTIDDVAATHRSNGRVSVYCHGMLAGRWNNNQTFEKVRFIDHFLIQDGLIVQQDVWNDLALHVPSKI